METHYIGKSTSGLIRPRQHMSKSHSEKVREWVEDLKSLNQSPVIQVIRYLEDSEDIDLLEEYFIKKFEAEGSYLLNNNLVTPFLILKTPLLPPQRNVHDRSDIANFLKTKRKQANLTQEELSSKSGVALTVIRKIEQNDLSKDICIKGVQTLLAMFGGKLTIGKINL